MTAFEKWIRNYIDASINHFEITGESLDSEQEIIDISKHVEENYIRITNETKSN